MKRRQFIKGLAVGAGLVLARPRVAQAMSRELDQARGEKMGAPRLTDPQLTRSGAETATATAPVPPAAGPTLLPSGQVLAPGVAPKEADAPAPLWLLAPLSLGSHLAAGWSVAEVSPINYGGFSVRLRSRLGETARVALCRLDADGARGLAHTAKLDLLLANRGHGRTRTHEATAQAIKTLARIIATNEDERVDALPLLSRRARIHRFGPGVIL